MTRPHDNSDDLERFIDQTLRELPQRQAPSTLESRVLAELARRAALPWWHRQFLDWPLAARVAFLLACFGSVTVTWIFASTDFFRLSTFPPTWIRSLSHVTSSMIDLSVSLIGRIPPGLLYSVLAFCVLLYGALLGLGAVGYHILYVDPRSQGLPQR
jgi:hypothetical protein